MLAPPFCSGLFQFGLDGDMTAPNQTFPPGTWRQIPRYYLNGAPLSSTIVLIALCRYSSGGQRSNTITLTLVETAMGTQTARLTSVRFCPSCAPRVSAQPPHVPTFTPALHTSESPCYFSARSISVVRMEQSVFLEYHAKA